MSKLLSNLPFLLNSFTFNHLCFPIHHFTTNNVTVLSSILIFSITSSKLFSLHLACHSRPFLCLLCSFLFSSHTVIFEGFPGGLDGKVSACNAGDPGSIPGSGRSPGEGNGNLLQHPFLENPMDGGAWQATVHGVAKSRTRLSDFTFTFTLACWISFVTLNIFQTHLTRYFN